MPYLLEERITNVDEDGYTGPDGRHYTTGNFERDIRLPDRTRAHRRGPLADARTSTSCATRRRIVFCVDDTHAAFMAQELRRLSGDPTTPRASRGPSATATSSSAISPRSGRAKPRVAVTVDLLTTGFDAPDVKNIVFARPLQSAILYKQMKGRGTRLCEDIDKRYFTIFDYVRRCVSSRTRSSTVIRPTCRKPEVTVEAEEEGRRSRAEASRRRVSVVISATNRYVCLADGRKIPFDEYTRDNRAEFIRGIAPASLDELLEHLDRQEHSARLRERAARTATSTSRRSATTSTSTTPTTSTSSPRSASTWCACRAAHDRVTVSGTRTTTGC